MRPLVALALVPLAIGCKRPPPSDDAAAGAPSALAWSAGSQAPAPAPSVRAVTSSPEGTPPAPRAKLPEGRPLHADTTEELLALFSVRPFTEREIKMRGAPSLFLEKNFGTTGPNRINQGNKALAEHAISREACLAALADTALYTAEDEALCGAPMMKPIPGKKGHRPRACIDVFEFPNQPCELPFVWTAPTQAGAVCELVGKRLCNQDEWTSACRADPGGGKDSVYAYGDELDLTICNTNQSAAKEGPQGKCDPDSARTAWGTCGTNTEPSGAFPRCTSRSGVYDLHGNVAEIMVRFDPDEGRVSQLKGSAFFYVDVARKHDERPKKDDKRETYPDHCAYDPRWHVEPMSNAWHVNYHLGFRCCKDATRGGR